MKITFKDAFAVTTLIAILIGTYVFITIDGFHKVNKDIDKGNKSVAEYRIPV